MFKKIIRKIIPYQLRFLINPLVKFLLHPGYRQRALYRRKCDRDKVNNYMVLYEAYHGASMTGNPYAVFTYLLDHPSYKKFQHVWTMIEENNVPSSIKVHPRVTIVKHASRDYVKHLATAKYLMNDTSFPFYFHKRKEQIYVNTWHGTPLKKMGIDIEQRGFADHKNIQRNFLFTDYLVSPNEYTYEKLLHAYDINTLFNGAILDTGYPRVDLMFNANKKKMKRKLHINDDQKIILYAPTWRGVLGEEENESKKLVNDIKKMQENNPSKHVLLKAHYYAEKFFQGQGLENVIVPYTIDTNELLAVVDILITDYSSIFFEFLPTKKPVIFYAYDEKEYLAERGTYILMDKLPGPLCHTIEEVIDAIQHDEIAPKYKETYEQFIERFCYHDDGQATKRFVDTVFEGKTTSNLFKMKTKKTKILMYGGGFLNNGITASAVNLLNSIDYEKFDVTLIDHGTNIKESKKLHMQKVNDNVHHIFRFGTWNASFLELCRHTFFLKTGKKHFAPTNMYKKEMKRITGLATFDIGIDFGGYSPFWAALFAFGNFKRKTIYFHSDMNKELDKKVNNEYPHRQNLKAIFPLYDQFDKVISVSKLVHEQNSKNMKQFITNYKQKMDYVINAIDYQRILTMSGQSTDFQVEFGEEFDQDMLQKQSKFGIMETNKGKRIFSMPQPNETNFITIGRLSPEKDHIKLIQAFHKLLKTHANIKLYIVGEGALEEQLKQLVSNLNLENKIILTGQLYNPYPLLSRCDCFVLSSNYEGQALVLLEALILGIPVITTDVPGPRSVVEGGYGLIVENTEEALVRGMQQFLSGNQLNERPFDYKTYQQDAVNMFYTKVCDIKD